MLHAISRKFFGIIALLIPFTSLAQIKSGTFTDQELKPDSRVFDVAHEGPYIYVGGSSSNSCGPTPLLAKVLIKTGETIWTTVSLDLEADENFPSIRTVKLIGDAAYAVMGTGWTSHPTTLLKFDKTTGKIIWRKTLPTSTGNQTKIYPYSSTQLVVFGNYYLYLVNIITGEVEKSYYDGYNGLSGVGLHQDIYWRGKKIVNFDFANPQTLPVAVSGSVYTVDSRTIIAHNTYELYAIDTDLNQVLWKLDDKYYTLSDFKVKGKYLYGCIISPYAGGSNIAVFKIDLSIGTEIWRKSYPYTTKYEEQFSDPGQGFPYSIDLDDSEDVYITGSANVRNYNGDMGVMKFSGATGEKIFDKIITEDISDWDQESYGVKAVVHENQPFFIGNVGASHLPSTGNNIVMVRLNKTTGDIEERNDIKGHSVMPSYVQQILPYLDEDYLVLENRGRNLNISRYDENKELIWSKKLKHQNYYGHIAVRIAADKDGNIAVAANCTALDWQNSSIRTDYGARGVTFLLDKDGNALRDVVLRQAGQVVDLHCDGENFYVLSNSNSAYLHKINTSGIVSSVEINYMDLPDGNSTSQFMDSKSNNELFIVGKYMEYAIVKKSDLTYTLSPNYSLLDGEFLEASYPIDIHVQNDSVYVIGLENETFISMLCYSLTSKKVVWTGPIVLVNSSQGGYYRKMVFDQKGNIYALGIGQYTGFMLRKINASTGSILWTHQRSYSTDIKAENLYYDPIKDQVAVTGHKLVLENKKYMTATFNASGTLTSLQVDDNVIGSGRTAYVTSKGEMISGGALNASCTTSSFTTNFNSSPGSPFAVNASEGSAGEVTISWTGTATGYYKIYRNTVDNAASAQPLTAWIQQLSYHDVTSETATGYHYFVQKASDASGHETSPLSASDYGYRGFELPVIQQVTETESSAIKISWTPSMGASVYRLFRGVTNDPEQAEIVSGWIASTVYIDSNVLPGEIYFYFVRAAADDNGAFATSFSNGMSGTIEIIAGTETGAKSGQLILYPNPVNDLTMLKYTSNYSGAITISFVDLLGREERQIVTKKENQKFEMTISLSDLPSGYHIVLVKELDQSTPTFRGKILK